MLSSETDSDFDSDISDSDFNEKISKRSRIIKTRLNFFEESDKIFRELFRFDKDLEYSRPYMNNALTPRQ